MNRSDTIWIREESTPIKDTYEFKEQLGQPGQYGKAVKGLRIESGNNSAMIYRVSEGNAGKPICKVNRIGMHILLDIDGRKTVKELALSLMDKIDLSPPDPETFLSSIALFLAEPGMAGILAEPFFVNIQRHEIIA